MYGRMERKREFLNCQEAQSLIVPFIKSELTIEQAKEFFEHIDNCADCKEELEVYYILLIGLKQLDEEDPESSDLHGQFEKHLNHARAEVTRPYLRKSTRMALLLALVAVLLVLITREQEELAQRQEQDRMLDSFWKNLPQYNALLSVPELGEEEKVLNTILDGYKNEDEIGEE